LDPFECPVFAGGEKELTMSMTFVVNDVCPKCSKPIKIAVIEPHPSRPDLAVHNFECTNCGPVRAKLISLKPGKQSEQTAA
jgi:ssDNA-binding Zn-finger/Zn-ribbon topoisomerase 1